jgi:hypothetical protein
MVVFVLSKDPTQPTEPSEVPRPEHPMDSRRLVVWISAGILGFQGGTLVLDLIHCSLLSWLYLRRYGLELVSTAQVQAGPPPGMAHIGPLGGEQEHPTRIQPRSQLHSSPSLPAPTQPHPRPVPLDPTEVFCNRPRNRVDEAVSQGLSILAGLALGGSVGGGGKADGP